MSKLQSYLKSVMSRVLFHVLVVFPSFSYLKKHCSMLFHSLLLESSGYAALPLPACYLQIWCIRALNLPQPISCLFMSEVDGPAPVGPGSRCHCVNMLKSEGQRGWSQYWYHPWNHFVTAGDSEWRRRRDDCEILAEGWGTPLKRQMWLSFSEKNALFLVIVSEVGLKGCDTEITLPPGV